MAPFRFSDKWQDELMAVANSPPVMLPPTRVKAVPERRISVSSDTDQLRLW